MHHFQAVMKLFPTLPPRLLQAVHDRAGRVVRAVIYCNDFIVGIVEFQQRRERGLDVFGFIASGNDDADSRARGRPHRPERVEFAHPSDQAARAC